MYGYQPAPQYSGPPPPPGMYMAGSPPPTGMYMTGAPPPPPGMPYGAAPMGMPPVGMRNGKNGNGKNGSGSCFISCYRLLGWLQIILFVVIIFLDIVALVKPYWTYLHTTYPEEFTEYSGLWLDCKVFGFKAPDCNRFSLFKLPSYYRFTQAFLLIATVGTVLSVIAGLLIHCTRAYEESSFLIGFQSFLVFLAVLTRFLALFIYSSTNFYDENQTQWGVGLYWCFLLVGIAEVLAVPTALYQVFVLMRLCT